MVKITIFHGVPEPGNFTWKITRFRPINMGSNWAIASPCESTGGGAQLLEVLYL